jgi:hypothetical protein
MKEIILFENKRLMTMWKKKENWALTRDAAYLESETSSPIII